MTEEAQQDRWRVIHMGHDHKRHETGWMPKADAEKEAAMTRDHRGDEIKVWIENYDGTQIQE